MIYIIHVKSKNVGNTQGLNFIAFDDYYMIQ